MSRLFALVFNGMFVVAVLAGSARGDSAPARDRAGFLPVPGDASAETSPLAAAPPAATPGATAPVLAAPAEATTDAATLLGGYILDDKHKLMPGDQISFQIKEDRSTNFHKLLVTESSELEIPYIGRVSISGKTCKQLADDLKVALEKDYYYHATVIIGLDVRGKLLGRVTVVGQVKRPGTVNIPANDTFTVGKAVLEAQGFTDFANPKKVMVIRKTPGGEKSIKVNLKNVFEDGRTSEDIVVEPDDLIIVPKKPITW